MRSSAIWPSTPTRAAVYSGAQTRPVVTERPERPTPPAMPPLVAARMRRMDNADRALSRAMRSPDAMIDAGEQLAAVLADLLLRPADPAYTAEAAAYEAAVRDYNDKADRYNRWLADQKQAKVNAREVAAVRAASCPDCFQALPASGVCGWC